MIAFVIIMPLANRSKRIIVVGKKSTEPFLISILGRVWGHCNFSTISCVCWEGRGEREREREKRERERERERERGGGGGLNSNKT